MDDPAVDLPSASASAFASASAPAPPTPTRRRRLGWFGAVIVLVAGGSAAAWFGGTRVRSPEQAAADAAQPDPVVLTAVVERRPLSSTVVTRGDVVPEVAVSVAGPVPDGGGQAVVTGVFVGVGDEVDGLVPVVEVSGRPVFVMEGDRPAYRTLGPGMSGGDVVQLQAGLVAGGCAAGNSGAFDEATKLCVAALYEGAGYSVTRGSESEEADLAAAHAAVEEAADEVDDAEAALLEAQDGPTELELLDAEQAVETARNNFDTATSGSDTAMSEARATVGEALRTLNEELVAANPNASTDDESVGADEGGSGEPASAGVAGRDTAAAALREALGGVTSARVDGTVQTEEAQAALTRAETELASLQAAPDITDEERAVEQAQKASERADLDLQALVASSGPTVPMGELVFVPTLPARVDSSTATVGQAGDASGDATGGETDGGSGALLVLSSAGLVVRSEVPASDAGLVSVGSTAEMLDEASGETVVGVVDRVGSSLVQSQAGGLVAEVVLTGEEELPVEWSGRNIRVTFTAASTSGPVLVVPAIAVSSGADGGERVEVLEDDGTISEVAVRTGLVAEGSVEVTPLTAEELHAGDKVVTDR